MSNNDTIHEDKVAYLCEIAFIMWANNTKYKCDKIIEKHGIDFDYDDYLNFYIYVYDTLNVPFPSSLTSLLDEIESTINTGIIYGMLDTFLSSYEK